MTDFVEKGIREAEYTLSQRQEWEPLWQSLADFELPAMADFTVERSPAQRRGERIINSVGLLSARECAIRVDGFLTGDGSEWFDLAIAEARVRDDPMVKMWLGFA